MRGTDTLKTFPHHLKRRDIGEGVNSALRDTKIIINDYLGLFEHLRGFSSLLLYGKKKTTSSYGVRKQHHEDNKKKKGGFSC